MSVKGEAIERLAKAAVKMVDDWGWKGGKKGEITGHKYKRALDAYRSGKITATDLDEKVLLPAFKQFERAAASGKPIAKRFNEEVAGERLLRNYAPNQPLTRQDMADIAELMLEDFYILERSGIPRKWTGKLISEMRKPAGIYEDQGFANALVGSPAMQGLTDIGRNARAVGMRLGNIMKNLREDTGDRGRFVYLISQGYDLDTAAKLAPMVRGI